jgi:hypothetical protein
MHVSVGILQVCRDGETCKVLKAKYIKVKIDIKGSNPVSYSYYLLTFLFKEGNGLFWNDSQTLFTVHGIPILICNLFMGPFHLISTPTHPPFGWRLVKF